MEILQPSMCLHTLSWESCQTLHPPIFKQALKRSVIQHPSRTHRGSPLFVPTSAVLSAPLDALNFASQLKKNALIQLKEEDPTTVSAAPSDVPSHSVRE